jgi:hypothetical protein
MHPISPNEEQRVANTDRLAAHEEEQRVINKSPIIMILLISNLPTVMKTNNPTAKRVLKGTKHLHRWVTRHNTPSIMPVPVLTQECTQARPRNLWQSTQTNRTHAINILTLQEQAAFNTIHTPRAQMKYAKLPTNFEHYANPMVHPVTGKTISSYNKLMHDPATAKVWQMAFGRDFGSMAQGDNKKGQKGMNAMFVMSHNEIAHAKAANKFFTYGNPVVDYRPQKEFPHRIRIMAGGNLINYKASALVCTADLDTAKLHWNSFISTALAKYMCLYIKNFYLMATLEYYKYMKIPLTLFPK